MRREGNAMKAQLGRALRDIRRGAERGVLDGAHQLAGRVRQDAPIESGAMRDSVDVEAAPRTRGKVAALVVVEGGHGAEPVPLHVEYGTLEEPPRPFVRPAVARETKPVKARIRAAVLGQIHAE